VKAPRLLLSHLALGLTGWVIVGKLNSGPPVEIRSLPTKTDRSDVRSTRARTLIAELADKIKPSRQFAAPTEAEIFDLQLRINLILPNLKLPPDVERAVEEAKKRKADPAEWGALLLAWARQDIDAAAGHLDMLPDDPDAAVLTAVGVKAGRETDPETALAIEGHHFDHDEPFLIGLAQQLVGSSSMEEVLNYVDRSEDTGLSEFRGSLPLAWPLDRGADLVSIAVRLDEPNFLGTFCARMPPGQGIKWLHEALNSGLDTNFVHAAVDGMGDIHTLVMSDASASLDERLAILMMEDYEDVISRERSRASSLQRLIDEDLEAFLEPDDQPDQIQDFRIGIVDAASLFEDFRRTHPGYDETEIRKNLWEELWTSDPRRAVTLLNPLPEQERDRMLIETLVDGGNSTHPDLLREAESLLSDPESNDTIQLRRRLWCDASYRYRQLFGADYTQWIAALRPGLERDLAFAGLADFVADDFPAEAASLRQRIADPRLKEAP
jgi:hypothetical protein